MPDLMKTPIRWLTLALLGLALLPATPAPAQAADRPNVLLIVADDLGARDLAFAGSTFYQTPRLDALAAQGVVFTQAYSAHPRCVPSRNALMTGQFPARNGQPGRGGVSIDAEDVTIAEAMRDAGYATFFAGKWHLGEEGDWPDDHGYDVNIAGCHAGAPRSYLAPYNESRSSHSEKSPIVGLDDAPEGEHLTDRLTTETIAWLEGQAADGDKPFFATVSYYAVHTPLMAMEEDTSRFDGSIPARPDGVPEFMMRDGQTKTTQDHPVYAAMVRRLDENVGRLLDTLEALGVADNTVVIFTSDHGGLSNRGTDSGRPLATSNLPLRAGKGHLYEGGVRVPMVVRWPGVTRAGTQSDALVVNIDHHAACSEIAGAAVLDGVDGVSYLPALRGEAMPQRGPVFWHAPRPRPDGTGDIACSAMREGPWKLMLWHASGTATLYHLEDDPSELEDRSRRNPGRAERMREQLEAWLLEVDAPEPRTTQGAVPDGPDGPVGSGRAAGEGEGGDEDWRNDPDRDRSPEARARRQAERERRRLEREEGGGDE